VIYTSGSTGKPKGVEITQHRCSTTISRLARADELRPEDRVLQFSPVSFDISVEEIFPACCAAAGVLRDDEVLSSTARFIGNLPGVERLSVLNLPTPTGTNWWIICRPL